MTGSAQPGIESPSIGATTIDVDAISDSSLTPRVSVVIATFNMGRFVSTAVESVLSQTISDLEVIVVDDGSTDDTADVLNTFSDNPRVKLIFQRNQGQPKAKNAGWRAAAGRFVAFCDADDYWLHDKLALQLPLLENQPQVGVVYSKTVYLDTSGNISEPVQTYQPRGKILEDLFVTNHVPFGTAVVRRTCLEEVGGFDETIPMGIDWDLWLRIARSWEFDCVPDATYVYRRWDGQMSHNWRGRYECALRIMERFLTSNPGEVSPRVVATAYADTYTNFAAACMQHGPDEFKVGLRYTARALANRPTFWPAWRVLMRAPVTRIRSALARSN
jgi:glycosyltransferase involved in cell wall biosynthesis